jgi:hypothetical protein
MDMRAVSLALAVSVLAPASAAYANTQTVAVVKSASADYSAKPHTITINATVEFPNTCWSHPRLKRLLTGPAPPANGIIDFAVQADVKTGGLCGQVVRTVTVPSFDWTGYRVSDKGVKVIGSKVPVVAMFHHPDH